VERPSAALLILASLVLWSCAQSPKTGGPALKFWHTFNQDESAALQTWLSKTEKRSVVTTILPFAVANIRVRSAIAEGACPDLLRIDSTRIPGLVESELIRKVPSEVWQQRNWLGEAVDLVHYRGSPYGLPQSVDGLALIRKRNRDIVWPIQSLDELEKLSTANGPRIGMLIDGYWALAFLRAEGGALPTSGAPPNIHSPQSIRAVERFAALFRTGVAMDLLDERSPSRAMIRAFRNDEIDIAFTGPWDLRALANGNPETLEVSAFPGAHAPRGGQVLVVPTCTESAPQAWELALALTAPKLQAEWAKTLGTIPVTTDGLKDAGPLANAFYQALVGTSPIPRHVRAPELFDDLSPAVLAVVGGDATAEEALAGVNRAWRRLYHLAPEHLPQEPAE
jgi:multiple sugar transport system substrate-binding protein